MTMTTNESQELLASLEVETEITRDDAKAVAVLARGEVEAQLDAAHRYPRNMHKFVTDAMNMATLTQAVAESCIYALPRSGKTIAGPSVRLAEIMASAYGNLHVATRIVDADASAVTAQGVAWDLEKNVRATIEVRRRITDRNGKRFNEDMIGVTGAAASSIALRNAIFKVVPRAYVDAVYARVKEVAVGKASTLSQRRGEVIARLQKIGVPIERIFARVGKTAIEDIGLDELEVLIGLGTTVKNNEQSIDAAFPPVDETKSKASALEAELAAKKPKGKTEKAEAPKTDPKPPVAEVPIEIEARAGEIKETLLNAQSPEEKKAAADAVANFFMEHGPAHPELAQELVTFAKAYTK